MGLRDRAWRALTAHGRALDAYERGLTHHEVTLEVLKPDHRKTLEKIASVGWRLDDTFEHPRVKLTDVTPRSDGGHDVVRTESQKTTFYFVRDDKRVAPVVPDEHRPAPVPQHARSSVGWPAGWYQTEYGLRWWDGNQWTQTYAGPPPQPHDQASYGTSSVGMSTREHWLHLALTLFTCGLWAPVWLLLARRRRNARPH